MFTHSCHKITQQDLSSFPDGKGFKKKMATSLLLMKGIE
ncbi:hypothetical protein DU19_0768 [Chlamydia muridarum]|nr:hypothetical protein DU17_0770 [Chlamydia muridarum]KDU81716.1 hypothetical protein DU18_0768 [Chlamydia muridarum]KDU82534.1 hypothetical protein DU19_0768 [Chlamydia muridarum]KDU83671.1 hypothetical protein DU20_0768 [Chlamydia muridarum]KDU84374.1 hypothetical protein DU21_0770 [Chlamydia muridarum]